MFLLNSKDLDGLRIHWRLSTILKTSKSSVWSNVFWCVKVFVFWKCIRYTIHWGKTQILKRFIPEKINGTKNAFFFLSQAHHRFTFNFQFLYELKFKFHPSKSVCAVLHFRFRFVFTRVYIFVQQNAWTLWL